MTTISDRISELSPVLMRKARAFATNDYTVEDVFQAICTAILESAAKNPAFVEQGDGYILKLAEWTAAHMNKDDRTYEKYVGQEKIVLDDNSEEVSDFDLIIDAGSAEDAAMYNIAYGEIKKAMKGLPDPNNRKIAYMLSIGYSKAEIADELHISRPAVSQRIQTIQHQLSSFALTDI